MLSEQRPEGAVIGAVRMEEGTGCEQVQGHIQSVSIGNETGTHRNTAEQSRSISTHQIEIDWKE